MRNLLKGLAVDIWNVYKAAAIIMFTIWCAYTIYIAIVNDGSYTLRCEVEEHITN
jgi:hypothetical protein